MPIAVALQTHPRFGERDANLAAAEALLGEGTPDLVVLSELFATGYSFRDREEALAASEPFPDGPTVAWLARVSARPGGVVVGGYAERDGVRLYNAAAACAAGRAVVSYRKVHRFGFEREVFDPGPGPFPVFEHRGIRVGVMICFDWRFPEAARALALAGADVIAHPSNLVLPHGQAAMVTRALENGVYAVTANRVGSEHRPPRAPLSFTGGSVIVTPRGETVARGSADRPARVEAAFDPAVARATVIASGNDVIRERRPDVYRI